MSKTRFRDPMPDNVDAAFEWLMEALDGNGCERPRPSVTDLEAQSPDCSITRAPLRVMLDSNAYDPLLKDAELLQQVRRAIESGRVTILTTHVQRDEHEATPNVAKRDALLAIPIECVQVATEGAVWDTSKLDQSKWEDGTGRIKTMIGGNAKHIEDALISSTANAEVDVLVTNEKRLPSRVKRAGFTVDVWSMDRFATWLRTPA